MSLSAANETPPVRPVDDLNLAEREISEPLAAQFGLSCQLDRGYSRIGTLRTWNVGAVRAHDITMAHCSVTPARRRPSDASASPLMLKLVLDGTVLIEQDGRHRMAGPGELFVLDPHQFYAEIASDPVRLACLWLPRRALADRGIMHRFHGCLLPDMGNADTIVVRDLVRSFIEHSYGTSPDIGLRLERVLLDVADVILTNRLSPESRAGRCATLHRAKSFMARHLGDPALDYSAISQGLRLSSNYLGRLFRAENTTMMRYLWTLRLEHAHRLLARHPSMRVDEAAYASGFSDAAHFSRAYRKHFGTTPSQARRIPRLVEG